MTAGPGAHGGAGLDRPRVVLPRFFRRPREGVFADPPAADLIRPGVLPQVRELLGA